MSLTLQDSPAIYPSERSVGQVLQGDEPIASLIKACQDGDDAQLRAQLSSPAGTDQALAKPHRVYDVSEPSADIPSLAERKVSARPTLNAAYLLEVACRSGHATAIRTLLAWAADHNIDLIDRPVVNAALRNGQVDVFAALAESSPTVVSFGLGHGRLPLVQAVTDDNLPLVRFLATHGASVSAWKSPHSFSLLVSAVQRNSPVTVQTLLELGASPSCGLHAAARQGAIEVMDVLARHGADSNEPIPQSIFGVEKGQTPMQVAEAAQQANACAWLKSHGATA